MAITKLRGAVSPAKNKPSAKLGGAVSPAKNKPSAKLGGVSLSAKNTRRRGVKKSVVAVSKKSRTVAADVKLRAAFLRRCVWFWFNDVEGDFSCPSDVRNLPRHDNIIGSIKRGSLFLIADAFDGTQWISKLCVDKIEAVKFIRLVCSRRA